MSTLKHFIFGLLVFASQAFGQQPQLSVEKIWRDYEFWGNSFSGFRSMNDGLHYTKLETVNQRQRIVKYHLTENTTGAILMASDKFNYNGNQIVADDYAFNTDETKILIMTGLTSVYRHSFLANYFLYDLSTGILVPLDEQRQPQTLAEYSPDGNFVSYCFENNIYIKELKTGKTRQITTDGKHNAIINGSTDWVYEEEFAITKGYCWSPDSKQLAFLRFDETAVPEFTMDFHRKSTYPNYYSFKYPKAGENNSKVTLQLYDLPTKKHKAINLGANEYIPRIEWSPVDRILVALTLNRHQNELTYHLIDSRKKISVKPFFTEKSETYVDIDDNLSILTSGSSIIRSSEIDGYNHLYEIGFDGTSKQITSGKWDVIDFYGIQEKSGLLFYSSAELGATTKTIYSIHRDGTNKQLISESNGYSDADFTKGFSYFVKSYSSLNKPVTYSLCDQTGKQIKLLEGNETLKAKLESYTLPQKEFTTFRSGAYDLNAWILKPKNFDPQKQYPVYLTLYCGPGKNEVVDQWDGQDYMYHQILAQNGYIVVSVDSRGTQFRGAAFKKSTYLNLGKLETEDILNVAGELKKLPYVDGNRLGIQGWSYGGFMTTLAMTKGKGMFKMGIAVAPVTNWKWYDNIYTERFMRTPAENKTGYEENSPVNFANQVQGKFLIIHGSGDDNVHIQNSYEMINALIESNKTFDQFVYPNRNHGIYGGNTRNHLFNMMLNYTLRNL